MKKQNPLEADYDKHAQQVMKRDTFPVLYEWSPNSGAC